ncbi:MAG TPA: hypothetical protein VMZ53_12580 [Kofleriaceae bacterium]|nr:hypothetical protein [Kofleriaceae bacterium]
MMTVPAARPYRMNADVMELDIAQIIASLEAEQTLVVSRRQVAAFSARKRPRFVQRVLAWFGGRVAS